MHRSRERCTDRRQGSDPHVSVCLCRRHKILFYVQHTILTYNEKAYGKLHFFFKTFVLVFGKASGVQDAARQVGRQQYFCKTHCFPQINLLHHFVQTNQSYTSNNHHTKSITTTLLISFQTNMLQFFFIIIQVVVLRHD